jgi:cell wall-associated NlpC family hydrolase
MRKLKLLIVAGIVSIMIPATPACAFEQIFAQCSEYINIRQDATTDSDVIAKIYNNCEATLLEEKGEWIRIKSGNAEGWVKSEYFAFGEEAEQIAAQTAYNVTTVLPEALVVRCAPDENAEEFGMVYANDELEVVEYEGDWMTVAFDDGTYGYVSAYYVSPTEAYYGQAETLQEEEDRLNQEWLDYLAEQKAEEERLNREWLEYLAQQEAEQKAAEQAWLEAIGVQQEETEPEYTYETESTEENYVDESLDNWDESYEESFDDEYIEEDYYEEIYEDEYEESYDDSYTDEGYYDADEDVYYSDSSTGQSIVDYACQFVGNPYVWGGTSLTNGADCSGFAQSVFANFGIYLPRTAASQSGSGTSVDLSNIQAGDLLFYSGGGGIDHVSIYMGGGQVVHASNSTDGIIISSYGYRTPTCARRYW